jgi:HK97 gp10 family phage protein
VREFTLTGFAAHLLTMSADIELAERAAIERACKIVRKAARNMLGTPQPFWPELKPETIARKANGNSPLLETGEMRDSIEYTVVNAHEGHVGSNNDKALWHELGTAAIPARPFLAAAAAGKEKEIVEMMGKMVHAAMLTGGVNYHELSTVLHALRAAGHAVEEMFDETDDDGKDK